MIYWFFYIWLTWLITSYCPSHSRLYYYIMKYNDVILTLPYHVMNSVTLVQTVEVSFVIKIGDSVGQNKSAIWDTI